jgi:hypothetical protein
MPLSIELANRYRALFYAYGDGRDELLSRTKRRIRALDKVLREDAKYFLLVNLDHMVIRSMAGWFDPEHGYGQEPLYEMSHVNEMIEGFLTLVMDDIGKYIKDGEAKASANAVIRAINAKSNEIAGKILWWREAD